MKCGCVTLRTWQIYLADIFGRLNKLNTSLQGPCTSIFVLRNKTDAFKQKQALWDSLVQKEDTIMFPILNEYLASADVNCTELQSIVSQHLKELANSFDHYFPEHEDPRRGNFWINNSFIEDVNTCDRNSYENESLIELCCDSTLQSRYKKNHCRNSGYLLKTNIRV